MVEDNPVGDYVGAVSAAATAEKATLATQKAGEYAAIMASWQALIDLAMSKRESRMEGDMAIVQRALDTLIGADKVFGAASASQDTTDMADTNHKAAGAELDEAQKAKVLWTRAWRRRRWCRWCLRCCRGNTGFHAAPAFTRHERFGTTHTGDTLVKQTNSPQLFVNVLVRSCAEKHCSLNDLVIS